MGSERFARWDHTHWAFFVGVVASPHIAIEKQRIIWYTEHENTRRKRLVIGSATEADSGWRYKRATYMRNLVTCAKFLVALGLFLFAMTFLLIVFFGIYETRQPQKIKSRLSKGLPYVFHNDMDYIGSIDQIAVIEPYVYLLYGKKHVIKCYTVGGEYVCSIAIKNKGGGTASMYTDSGHLYVESSGNGLYEFTSNTFSAFHESVSEAASKIRAYKRTNTDSQGNKYVILRNTAYIIRRGTVSKFIHRKWFMQIASPTNVFVMVLFNMIVIVLCFSVSKELLQISQ